MEAGHLSMVNGRLEPKLVRLVWPDQLGARREVVAERVHWSSESTSELRGVSRRPDRKDFGYSSPCYRM